MEYESRSGQNRGKIGAEIKEMKLGQLWGEIGADFGEIEFKIITDKAG